MSKARFKLQHWLLVLLAGLLLGANSGDAQSQPDLEQMYRNVAGKLACLCGACTNTVLSCPMLGCHYAAPARELIKKMLAEGKSEKEVIAYFIRREGTRALAAPPVEGFYAMAWWMPYIGLAVGFVFVFWVLKRLFRPAPASQTAVTPELEKYRQEIEKQLEQLE